METTQENIRFYCPECKKFFIATRQDYDIIVTVLEKTEIKLKQGYCPICGIPTIQTDDNDNNNDEFLSSGGGKF